MCHALSHELQGTGLQFSDRMVLKSEMRTQPSRRGRTTRQMITTTSSDLALVFTEHVTVGKVLSRALILLALTGALCSRADLDASGVLANRT